MSSQPVIDGNPIAPSLDRPALVGRERELAALSDALALARSGRGQLTLVAGEAGIGKTRLIDAFADVARGAGALVVWGRCWEAGGAPEYWPWVQVIRATLRAAGAPPDDDMRQRLAAILPELRTGTAAVAPADPDAARFQLFDAVTAVLRSHHGAAPLVVVLDDLHAADEPSLLLLQFAAANLTDAPVLFVASYRDPELEPRDPRQALLAALGRHSAARRVSPSALTEEDIGALVAATAGYGATPTGVRVIARETEGNPLFVSEVVRLLVDEGLLDGLDDKGARLPVPAGVKAVIGRRLDRLSRDCFAVLQVASVIGREFGMDLLTALGMTSGAVIAAIDEATEARVVHDARTGLGRWRFGHVLIRDVLYESLSLPARMGLHDRVGRALEQLVGDEADERLSELAHHAVMAAPGGDAERAVRYSMLAGHRATSSAAHEEAVRHFRNAVSALELGSSAGDDELRCGLLNDLGEAEMRAGVPTAPETLLAAGALAERLALPDELARAALAYAGRFVWHRAGRDTTLIPFLERAIAARGDRRDRLRTLLLARLSGALRGEVDVTRRDALSAEALEIAREVSDPGVLSYALVGRMMAIWGPDTQSEIERLGRELQSVAEASGDVERIGDALWMKIAAISGSGLTPDETDDLVGRYTETVQRLRQPSQTWYRGVMRTIFALASGDFDMAGRLIEETRQLARGSIEWHGEFSYRLARFALAFERDELGPLLPDLASAARDLPGYWLLEAAHVYAEAQTGSADVARRQLRAMASNRFRDLPRDNNWTWALCHLALAALALRDRHAIETLLELLTPYRTQAAVAAGEVIGGPVGRIVGELATDAGRFDEAEEAFRDAFALVERSGWRPWEGWTRLSRARMLLARGRAGDDDAARRDVSTAAAIADEFGMTALRRQVSALGVRPGEPLLPRAADPRDAGEVTRGRFVHEGEVWAITLDGQTVRLRDSKGLQYLAQLLRAPGREIAAVDLAAGPAIGPGTLRGRFEASLGADTSSKDEVLDADARAAYRARLRELQSEIDEAESFSDGERAARMRAEFDFLTRELAAATGLGGRSRATSSAAERARQSVAKAIREALDRIGQHHPDLGAHLRHAVRTGILCSYAPDPRSAIRWEVA